MRRNSARKALGDYIKPPGGFDKLLTAALANVREEFEAHSKDVSGDSEIERLWMLALTLRMSVFRHGDCLDDLLVSADFATAQRLMDTADNRGSLPLIVVPQCQLAGWRVDYLVCARGVRFRGWRYLIVECDGHDFHERTKEQAARDRCRDRDAQLNGYSVFRFTGSEIWRDAWGCADRIIDWAMKGV